jgi:hypothetical protein
VRLSREERKALELEQAKRDRLRAHHESWKEERKKRQAIISFAPEVTFVYGAAK